MTRFTVTWHREAEDELAELKELVAAKYQRETVGRAMAGGFETLVERK